MRSAFHSYAQLVVFGVLIANEPSVFENKTSERLQRFSIIYTFHSHFHHYHCFLVRTHCRSMSEHLSGRLDRSPPRTERERERTKRGTRQVERQFEKTDRERRSFTRRNTIIVLISSSWWLWPVTLVDNMFNMMLHRRVEANIDWSRKCRKSHNQRQLDFRWCDCLLLQKIGWDELFLVFWTCTFLRIQVCELQTKIEHTTGADSVWPRSLFETVKEAGTARYRHVRQTRAYHTFKHLVDNQESSKFRWSTRRVEKSEAYAETRHETRDVHPCHKRFSPARHAWGNLMTLFSTGQHQDHVADGGFLSQFQYGLVRMSGLLSERKLDEFLLTDSWESIRSWEC